jgi:hypothetical protein
MKLTNQSFRKQLLAVALLFPLLMSTACSVDQVLSDIDVALQATANLSTALGAINPADGAAITLITGLATSGINAIKTAYDDYESSKTASNLQNILAAANAVQTNLPQMLTAAKISDPATVAKVTAYVSLVTDTAAAIVSTVQAQQPAAAGQVRTARAITVTVVTPESLQSRWTSDVCKGDAACGNLVKVHKKHAKMKL